MKGKIWILGSAFPDYPLDDLLKDSHQIGYDGIEMGVFMDVPGRKYKVPVQIDYDHFTPVDAKRILEKCQQHGKGISISGYEQILGARAGQKKAGLQHLLKLIRVAALLGGDENDIKVGTFVGYDHGLGLGAEGFERNLEEFSKLFGPVISYASDLGVTVLYENCPMQGWHDGFAYNNLPATLGARVLMYDLVPSRAHGEIYDPSHDILQFNDPVKVVKAMDISRLHRVHVKSAEAGHTRHSVFWGNVFPCCMMDEDRAAKADIPRAKSKWARFDVSEHVPTDEWQGDMDWPGFLNTLKNEGYTGPLVIEYARKKDDAMVKENELRKSIQYIRNLLSKIGQHEETGQFGYEIEEKCDIPVMQLKKLCPFI